MNSISSATARKQIFRVEKCLRLPSKRTHPDRAVGLEGDQSSASSSDEVRSPALKKRLRRSLPAGTSATVEAPVEEAESQQASESSSSPSAAAKASAEPGLQDSNSPASGGGSVTLTEPDDDELEEVGARSDASKRTQKPLKKVKRVTFSLSSDESPEGMLPDDSSSDKLSSSSDSGSNFASSEEARPDDLKPISTPKPEQPGLGLAGPIDRAKRQERAAERQAQLESEFFYFPSQYTLRSRQASEAPSKKEEKEKLSDPELILEGWRDHPETRKYYRKNRIRICPNTAQIEPPTRCSPADETGDDEVIFLHQIDSTWAPSAKQELTHEQVEEYINEAIEQFTKQFLRPVYKLSPLMKPDLFMQLKKEKEEVRQYFQALKLTIKWTNNKCHRRRPPNFKASSQLREYFYQILHYCSYKPSVALQMSERNFPGIVWSLARRTEEIVNIKNDFSKF